MTQRERVLDMLKFESCTTADFLDACIPRFSARIEELRREGHNITSKRVRDGSWRYTLVSERGAGQSSSQTPRPSRVRRGPSYVQHLAEGRGRETEAAVGVGEAPAAALFDFEEPPQPHWKAA